MDSDEDPNIHIGDGIGGSFIFGDNNVVHAPRPFNDAGAFLPMARNALFTGREAALKELKDTLSPLPRAGEGPGVRAHVVITQAITGMGGIGKSQLALEFAYRSLEAKDFVSAHWLNLADPSQLNAEIAACGRQMGLLDDTAKQPDMVAETLRVWAIRGPRLLVLDNYESAADALQTLAPLLNLSTVRLLITARRADFPPELGLRPYALEVFSPEDSVKFLRKLVRLSEEQTPSTALGSFTPVLLPGNAPLRASPSLEKLAETLGHLPLALHLAGHYLRETGITPAEYLRELDEVLAHESMQAEWFKEIGIASPTTHEQSLLGTFALSWQKVTDERAQTIFKVAGYLASNTPIPVGIFAAVLEVEEKDRTLKRALRQLVDKVGLFTSKDGLPVIHPLLAAYARHLNGESIQLLEKLADELGVLSTNIVETGLPIRFVPLSLHIVATTGYAEQTELKGAGVLWNNYGYHLREIANYAGSRAAFERAIRIWEVNLGENHPQVALGVNNLGDILRNLGDLTGARAALERAIRIWEASLGENHLVTAFGVNNLGAVLLELSDLDGARAAFERAIRIWEANLGENHPQVAMGVNNLGEVLRNLGDLDGAHAAFERAIQIWEANLGETHPNVAMGVNNLGGVVLAQGNLTEARAAFERAIRIWEANLGENHPQVAMGVNNLGEVLRNLGNLDGAHAAFERAIQIWEANLGENHTQVATGVNNLGLVLRELGDLDGARTTFERAIRIWEANLGENHPNMATGVMNLGVVLQAQGEKEPARVCGRRALAIFEQFLPAGHPSIENVKGWLKSLEG